jgi:hypothetical protein
MMDAMTAQLAKPCPHFDRRGNPVSCTEAEALGVAPNEAQAETLRRLCAGSRVEYDHANYRPAFDLPKGWVTGWVGPVMYGVDPEGRASS